jgi:hypothetical protein
MVPGLAVLLNMPNAAEQKELDEKAENDELMSNYK